MSLAKSILIRALSCIESEGYVTKDKALIAGVPPTSQRVATSFETLPDISDDEMTTYGPRSDVILDWIMNTPAADNEYLTKCKESVTNSDTKKLSSIVGYVCSLPSAHERFEKTSKGLDLVTQPNAFAADAGELYEGTGIVINVQHFPAYAKLSMVDTNGFLVTFTANKETKKTLTLPEVGYTISMKGKVYRNKFTTPFETTISRPTMKRIA